VITNAPRASPFARRDFSARGTGVTAGEAAFPTLSPRAALRLSTGASARTAFLMCRTCSGVVPQHPPTRRTPLAMNRRAYDAMYSGEQR